MATEMVVADVGAVRYTTMSDADLTFRVTFVGPSVAGPWLSSTPVLKVAISSTGEYLPMPPRKAGDWRCRDQKSTEKKKKIQTIQH
jgi:hypothetical protein